MEEKFNKKYLERYSQLNERQKEAVDTTEGPVLVVAGPGSGKTELLSIRTAKILKTQDINPQNILLLTFTEAGSFNMRERLALLIGETAYRVNIFTFHAFASDIISKYPEYFFDGLGFNAAGEIDQLQIVENILKNLPRQNPLGVFHPELGFVYSKDIISCIRDLKKGNLTPEKFGKKLLETKKYLKELRGYFSELDDVASKRKYSEVIPSYVGIYEKLRKLTEKKAKKEINEIAKVLCTSLEFALKRAEDEQKSKPLTAWKNTYFTKDENNKTILKDEALERLEKLESLLAVYTMYQDALHKKAIYDFEDMILEVIKALEKNSNLKHELQEKFQYIMLDEFQDTNESQFQMVKELSSPLYGNNILAVGDDDQAIFKFQGAEINNIYAFLDFYKNTKVIVLDKNYRSTQDILDFAREVIVKAEDRLETRDKNISKKIESLNKEFKDKKIGEIKVQKFSSPELEYNFVAKEIQKLLKNGVSGAEIAIITRKHEHLKNLATVLSSYEIPFNYSKRENILEQQHIHELITIVKFLSLQQEGKGEELLPEILSFDFWGVERLEIWKIAERVKGKNGWLSEMHKSENKKIRNIANFLISLSVKTLSTPLELILDELIGNTEQNACEDNDDDFKPKVSIAREFVSPYKSFYFKKPNLDFLFSLKTFLGALREFHGHNILKAKDIFEFEEIYSRNGLSLSAFIHLSTGENSVSLLTAHGAKGLEFEYVFLVAAEEKVWLRSGMQNKIKFPINMPLTPETDNDDDKIRLLYVALTRAKHTLYISYNSQKLGFLKNEEDVLGENKVEEEKTKAELENDKEFLQTLSLSSQKNLKVDEKEILKNLLRDYKLSATHLRAFLNFLEVGPEQFFEQCILHFPQSESPTASFGTAMHKTVEEIFTEFQKSMKIPTLKTVQNIFKEKLERQRLTQIDFKKFYESGIESLKVYLKFLNKELIWKRNVNFKVEARFKNEAVYIGNCEITGNIDRIEFVDPTEVIVTDLKTGTPYESFEEAGLQDYEKVKLHFYKYQLIFYALLIENSKSFNSYKVKCGCLEFIEPNKKGQIVTLPLEINNEVKERVVKLSEAVCRKIHNFDLPDTSKYPKNYKGILQFEEDLLNGNI